MARRCKCGIFSKFFSNQKAVGGHMRSHLAFHRLPLKSEAPSTSNATQNPSQPSSSGLAQKRRRRGGRVLNNPTESSTPYSDEDHKLLTFDSEITVTRVSSEIPHSIGKDNQISKVKGVEISPHSSIDSIFLTSSLEEDAIILLNFSRGERINNDTRQAKKGKQKLQEYMSEIGCEEEENDFNDGDDEDFSIYHSQDQIEASMVENEVHPCGACKEVFGSHQSLEQYKEQCILIHAQLNTIEAKDVPVEKYQGKKRENYPCPTCSKVFESGRALGGHKKVHKRKTNMPDLNLPPPNED